MSQATLNKDNATPKINIPHQLKQLLDQKPALSGLITANLERFTLWITNSGIPFFKGYTDHGPQHVADVLATASSLINDNSREILSANDAATLVIAVLLHDVGMHLTEDDFRTLINEGEPSIIKEFDKKTWRELSKRDDTADTCTDSKGNPEPNTNLRDTELVPLPEDISFPLPINYDAKADNSKLLDLVRDHCEAYLTKEVKPHVLEAWIDHSKTKIGYEIPLNRHFYVYQLPCPLEEIERDIKQLEQDIINILGGIAA